MKRCITRSVVAGGLVAMLLGSAWAAPERYRLGAEDRVRLRVNEWRAAKGETYEWSAFSGEFTVDAGGQLSLPLIGSIDAAGLTTEEIAAVIGERLQKKAGLTQPPDASVEVSQFRPIYVVGQVDKPGAYPYRPRLTVLQAVSLAGGFYRPQELGMQRLSREAVSARGELRDAQIEQLSLIARKARLEAETRDNATLTFPDSVSALKGTPAVADAMREEQALFAARRNALLSELEALAQAKELIKAEIETLQAKIASQDRQLALARKELESISSLVQRGLSISPRQLGLEQTVAQMESARLDNVLAISRSRQDISRNERTVLDLKNQRQTGVLADLREVQTKLAKAGEKADTMRSLIIDSEVIAPRLLEEARADRRRRAVFALVRQRPEGAQEIAVSETDVIEPGDVLKVDGESPDTGSGARRSALGANDSASLASAR